jgi:hypothetical protein
MERLWACSVSLPIAGSSVDVSGITPEITLHPFGKRMERQGNVLTFGILANVQPDIDCLPQGEFVGNGGKISNRRIIRFA